MSVVSRLRNSEGQNEGERLEIDTLITLLWLFKKMRTRIRQWQWQRNERHHPWVRISRNTESSSHEKYRDFATNGGDQAQYWSDTVCRSREQWELETVVEISPAKFVFYFVHHGLFSSYCYYITYTECWNFSFYIFLTKDFIVRT